MTGTELAVLIRSELLEPVAGFWTDTELLSWINLGERDFSQRVHGLQSTATLDTVQGRMDYPLPSNWISARALFYNDEADDGTDNWKRIWPTNLEKVAQEHPNFLTSATEGQGIPSEYFIWGNSIYFRQVPNATGKKIKMFYQSKAVALTSLSQGLNTDDTLIDGIKSYVLWKAWTKEKEVDLATEQREMYFHYVGEGRRWVKKQSGDQSYRIDINSPIGFSFGSNPTNIFGF